MKFYKRYPGDINIKTGDLSLVEFGAYDRLLDHYYAKEKPIEPSRVYTVTRCQCAADRHAVDRVLSEYWTLTELGWIQQRADEMIADALPRIEAARQNGKKGGRPRKQPQEQKPNGFSTETQTEPRPKTNQIPESSIPSEQKTARTRATAPCPEGVEPQVWTDWLALRKSKKAPVTATVIASATKEAEKAGMTLTAFLTVWCARGSQGLQADWLKPAERAVGRAPSDTEPEWRRQQRERNEAFYGPAAASRQQPPTLTAEEVDDVPLALD